MANNSKGIDQELVRNLANILNDTDLTEIEVEQDQLRIRVSRNAQLPPQAMMAPMPNMQPAPVTPAMTAHAVAPEAATQSAPADTASQPSAAANANAVPSPMVGTAYLAPSPDSAPFVKVGDQIKEGQTLVIIEAMKTMNQIPSPKAGKVVQVLVEDGQPVEFGDPLVIVE